MHDLFKGGKGKAAQNANVYPTVLRWRANQDKTKNKRR